MSLLPPAFVRLATVLELSAPDFSLSFVTGPRDHVDSVYLRLVRALGGTYEFVRHRVDREGVNLRAALGGGSGERPRVVFVSGLERMSDEARADATARLNLVRDSWGPYPAQVVFWLPSWGLAEFRRLAPDLFDWRSNLTVLHDADLPVRDEEELLCWSCERYRAQRTRARWVTFRREPATAALLSPTDILDNSRLALLLGLDATERAHLFNSLAATSSQARLREHVEERERFPADKLDLDVLRGGHYFSAPSRATVALDAADAVGKLDPNDGWTSLVRAAGIPSADDTATVLASLAASGKLGVLLGAHDLLNLSPGTPEQRWLVWLIREHPRLWVCAATSGASSDELAQWHIFRAVRDTAILAPGSPQEALADLLFHLFSKAELQSWAVYWFGEDFALLLPIGAPVRDYVAVFIRTAEQQGLLDEAFFRELRSIRLRFAAQIDAVARAYLHEQ